MSPAPHRGQVATKLVATLSVSATATLRAARVLGPELLLDADAIAAVKSALASDGWPIAIGLSRELRADTMRRLGWAMWGQS